MVPQLSNRQSPVSGFHFEYHLIRTFYDHAEDRWVYERWENMQLIRREERHNPRSVEHLFVRSCHKILQMKSVERDPVIPEHHLPPGDRPPHVRTYQPGRRKPLDLLTYYRVKKLRD